MLRLERGTGRRSGLYGLGNRSKPEFIQKSRQRIFWIPRPSFQTRLYHGSAELAERPASMQAGLRRNDDRGDRNIAAALLINEEDERKQGITILRTCAGLKKNSALRD